jgi:hypothetical protein
MDYTEIYNSTYQATYNRIELLTKNFFKKASSIDKSYRSTFNEFSYGIFRELSLRLDPVFNLPDYTKLFETVQKRNILYSKNQINRVFEIDIQPNFKTIAKTKLPENYNFKKLIYDFAAIQAINDLQGKAVENSQLLELIYDLERFELFEIRNIEKATIEEDENYRNLLQIKNNINPVLNFEGTLPADEIGLELLNYLCENYRPDDSTQVRFINIHHYMRYGGNKNLYYYKLIQKDFKKLILKNYNIEISKFQKSENYLEEEKPFLNSKTNLFFKNRRVN